MAGSKKLDAQQETMYLLQIGPSKGRKHAKHLNCIVDYAKFKTSSLSTIKRVAGQMAKTASHLK